MNLEYKKIKDFAVIHSGTTPSTSKPEFWNGEIKWITPAELEDGPNWYVFDTERKITEAAVSGKNLKMLKPGTVLLTSRAPIGKVALVGESMCTNQGFKNIECDTNVINPEFLYFWLLGKKEYLNSLGRGATFKEISKTIVENILVPVPKLEIQDKIVKVLKQSLSIIDKRKAQIIALSLLSQSVFFEMFGDPQINTKKWKTYKLSELVYSIKKQNLKKSSNVVKYIDISSIDNFSNKIVSYTEYIGSEAPSRAQQIVQKNDILISTVRPNLKNVAMIKDNFGNLIASTGFSVLRCNEQINSNFLFQLIKSDGFTQNLVNLTSGANYPAVKNSDVLNQEVIVPPIEQQYKYSEIVNQIELQKLIHQQGLTILEQNFEALMHRAFNGDLFND